MRSARTVLATFPFLIYATLATAAPAKKLGDIKVTAVGSGSEIGEDEKANHFTFVVDQGRIFVTNPGTPRTFDLSKGRNGCLRGTVVPGRYGAPHPVTPDGDKVQLRQLCQVAAGPSAGGAYRWADQLSTLTFLTQVIANGARIVVASGNTRAEFLLGGGAAADELRKRPELIAAAFAYGYVPPSYASSDGSVEEYRFVVAAQ
jgi:hypothetical protein